MTRTGSAGRATDRWAHPAADPRVTSNSLAAHAGPPTRTAVLAPSHQPSRLLTSITPKGLPAPELQ